MRRKLSEFLDLRQGTAQFMSTPRSLTTWRNMEATTLTLMRRRPSSFAKDRLILSPTLSYNELASAAIDQEGLMRACEVVEDKKKKRMMLGSSEGSSSGAPQKYRMVYTLSIGQPRRPPQFWGNHPQF
jgi:hypothetical protein